MVLASRFDVQAARDRGQDLGDGTPVHVTVATDDPWVPLRILGLGRDADEQVEADVFLLTEAERALLSGNGGNGLTLERSESASDLLLDDLRSDEGLAWAPEAMWFSHFALDTDAGALDYDLAADASSWRSPSSRDAGLALGLALAGVIGWRLQ